MKGSVVRGAPGQVRMVRRWPTPIEDPARAVMVVLEAVDALCRDAEMPAAVGLAIPGLVDEDAGVGVYSENIRWRDVPFRDLIARRTGLPVAVAHDVRAGGLAERELGAAQGAEDALFLPIGTGISGALIVAGELVTNPYAGEIGHIDVHGGEDCVCGAHGCLEAVASAAAIARRYSRDSRVRVSGAIDVLAALEAGDAIAARVWNDAIAALARALIAYISLLAPEVVVVGGGLAHAGSRLFDPLRAQIHDLILWQQEPRIVPAALGDDAAQIGAALLAGRLLRQGGAPPGSADHLVTMNTEEGQR